MATPHGFEYASDQSAFGKEGIFTGIGDNVIYWFNSSDAAIVPTDRDRMFMMGSIDGDLAINHTLEVKEIDTSVPGKVIGVVKIGEKVELPLSFMSMTQKTKERILGSALPVVGAYATLTGGNPTVDETPPAATNYSLVLSAVVDLKVGDTIEVPLSDGQFEYTIIEAIDTTLKTVYLNPPISQIPADLAVIKKVKSLAYKAGGNKLPKPFGVVFKKQDNSSESFDLYVVKRAQIKAVTPLKSGSAGKDLEKGGFTLICVPSKISYVDPDDSLTKTGWLFYEKTTFFKQ